MQRDPLHELVDQGRADETDRVGVVDPVLQNLSDPSEQQIAIGSIPHVGAQVDVN